MNEPQRQLSHQIRLIQRLSEEVDPEVIKRALDYFDEVRFTRCTPTEVRASVEGEVLFEVAVTRQGRCVKFGCTCPAFEDILDVCKHVWAVVSVGVNRGFLRNVADPGDVYFEALEDDEFADSIGAKLGPGSKNAPPIPSWERMLLTYLARVRGRTVAAPQVQRALSLTLTVVLSDDFGGPPAGGIGEREGLMLDIRVDEALAYGKTRRVGTRTSRDEVIRRLPENAAAAIAALCGVADPVHYEYYSPEPVPERVRVDARVARRVLPDLCRQGLVMRPAIPGSPSPSPLAWDDGGPWDLVLGFTPRDAQRVSLVAEIRRGGSSIPWADVLLSTSDGFLVTKSHLALVNLGGAMPIVVMLREEGGLTVAEQDVARLAGRLLAFPNLPPIEPPPQSGITVKAVHPVAEAHVGGKAGPQGFDVDVTFDYGGRTADLDESGSGWCDGDPPVLVRRDPAFEADARTRLDGLGFKHSDGLAPVTIPAKKLPHALRELIAAGWRVTADGKLFRTAGAWNLSVASGVDWFDLEGGIAFGDEVVPLPRLLAAARKGQGTIVLGDGSIGMLPEEWLRKYGALAGLGAADGERVRFSRGQAGMLDALLAAQPEIEVDEGFARMRARLRTFEKIEPAVEPPSFRGELRPYQREGLAWLRFLEDFGFGGCLADDMGLGKTVEVLAYLAGRKRAGPVMVVCPRSLVFNWNAEAARFAPSLRVLDHTGPDRRPPGPHFAKHDLVLATYGILRKDAPELAKIPFDVVILDESQAIKNRDTESAKAARLLSARHRLALSGTPIENRLAELGSMFEFLNPGLLGSSTAFEGLASGRDPAALASLAKALRPFILRRTKEQVVKDLPSKTEQTISCELEGPQRRLYDELRDHYRASLLGKLNEAGLKRAKIQVLEALLRLRQAACHPGLIDKSRAAESSPKLDLLLSRLEEVTADGHKALVFSQFTSLLAIVKTHLDARGLAYEYLDGQTHDREAVVTRFRTSPCPVFLISLKAGGLGLNLVEADYVFLLDPWWNPAVEAQAIDRTHRIGQTRPVFAYRLIARDTVEEKVLALQSQKRALADAIIRADESLIRSLTRKDLELLLS